MRLLLILVGISFSFSVSGQKGKVTPLKWRNDPAQELKIADSEYSTDKKGLVMYYFSNDTANLYVDMKIKETLEQNKILRIGMTIWISLDGKSQKKAGIRYPIGSEYSSRRKDFETMINPPTPLSQATMLQLVGFKDVQPVRFPAENKDNIRGKVKYNEKGDLIYSLVIPFSKLSVLKESTDPSAMTIGIEYGAPPERGGPGGGMPQMSSGGGGRPPSGGGSRGGGGGGGSMGGSPGGGARPSASTSTSTELGSPVLFWIKEMSLAVNK
jgi:hypothetical protein